MRDPISQQRIALLHPKVRQEATDAINEAEAGFPPNIRIRVAQGLRTFAEQTALYNQRPKVTNAKAGSSFHNYGLAIDFCLLYDKDGDGKFEEVSWDIIKDFDKNGKADWQEVVAAFEKRGWTWGGRWRTFKDNPHVEKSFGYTWRQLLAMYNGKQFIAGTEYVRI